MCVIVCKPKGVELPSKEILSQCFTKNPDGAGFMYIKNDKVRISKGYFTFEQFYEDVSEIGSKDMPLVMHFRIVSRGSKNAENTHPFPIVNDEKIIKNQNVTCDIGVAHNGTISSSLLSISYTDSDTCQLARDLLPLVIDNPQYYKDKDTITLISRLIGTYNKLAILSKDGHIEMINQFNEEGGCFYSNLLWKPYKSTSYNYDDYYDYYHTKGRKYSWEFFQGNDGEYDFDDNYCPASVCDDYSYCDKCKCCKNCKYRIIMKGGK